MNNMNRNSTIISVAPFTHLKSLLSRDLILIEMSKASLPVKGPAGYWTMFCSSAQFSPALSNIHQP